METDLLTTVILFFHVILSILVIVLVLLHSGADSGMGSIGGGPGTGGGGTHIMERNLNRVTVFVAILYLATTISLSHLF